MANQSGDNWVPEDYHPVSALPAPEIEPSRQTFVAPIRGDQDVAQEVEVPLECVAAVIGEAGAGIENIKRRAGGDVRVEFVGMAPSGTSRVVKIHGPRGSVGLCGC